MSRKLKLRRDLAENIVRFSHYKNNKDQSVCVISAGPIILSKTHALDGEEDEVLEAMANAFWSVKESVSFN